MPDMPASRKRPQKSPAKPRLRARLWLESPAGLALTESGADLLEQIDAVGSLSEAARRLRFSYRRAWLLLDSMNTRWPRPLARTQTGGRRGGGAHLTDTGHAVLRAYRDLQLQLEDFLSSAAPAFYQAASAV
jgi:molybdate transport system regulatory protein